MKTTARPLAVSAGKCDAAETPSGRAAEGTDAPCVQFLGVLGHAGTP